MKISIYTHTHTVYKHNCYDLKINYLNFQFLVISRWYFSEAYGVK